MTNAAQSIPQSAPERQTFIDEPVSDVGDLSQWQLMRIRFSKNKLAMLGLWGMVAVYIIVFLGDFIAPNWFQFQDTEYIFGPPSPITFTGPDGRLGLQPYTYGTRTALNQDTFKFEFVLDKTKLVPIKFFVKGDPVKVLGFKTDERAREAPPRGRAANL